MYLRKRNREKRKNRIAGPLVCQAMKDKEGAGNPEITKVKKKTSWYK